jgi:hypothetical protein
MWENHSYNPTQILNMASWLRHTGQMASFRFLFGSAQRPKTRLILWLSGELTHGNSHGREQNEKLADNTQESRMLCFSSLVFYPCSSCTHTCKQQLFVIIKALDKHKSKQKDKNNNSIH